MNAANLPSFKSRWQRAIGESDLPSNVRHVLLAVSVHFMDEQGGHCFPSISDVMHVTGLSKMPVVQHLNRAVETGWLERWHFGKGKANRRWNYQAIISVEIAHKNLDHQEPVMVENLDHQEPVMVENLDHQEPVMVENLDHQEPVMVENLDHKPCRDITMERESNHARGYPREAETTASAFATAPALSVSEPEKNRMTKLTDAVIEAAQKTIRQRNVREDLSDAALSHSIEKCRALKGYCEMTEAAWIETVVQWVGKERLPNGAASRCETVSPGSAVASPEETARQTAAYAARMAAAEAQHRQRLEDYRAAQHPVTVTGGAPPVVEHPADPVQALRALAAKVRMETTTVPAAPVQRTFGPLGALPARRPPLTAERREALNQVLQEMQKSGCAAADLNLVYQGVRDAPEDAWPAVIAQARHRLTRPAQAVA